MLEHFPVKSAKSFELTVSIESARCIESDGLNRVYDGVE
jgi:hypothetical protein